MKLTTGQRNVLARMWELREEPEGELVRAVPGGWWLGDNRIQGAVGLFLVRCCLVRERRYSSGGLTCYVAAEEVGKVLDDAAYIPEIFHHVPHLAHAIGAKW